MGYECPHCGEEIDCLKYCEDATIYGSYDIETEDYEQEETEGDGGVRFRCPECDESIGSTDDLINTEEEERRRQTLASRANMGQETAPTLDIHAFDPRPNINEEEKELPVPPAIDQNWRGEYSGYHNSHDRQKESAILTCSECGSKNEAIENETVECYICGKKLNQTNAKKIIQVEKPNNPGF
jgi:predicted RNA-binding Zn-ribbon protein involved in translation (DUF1610 family)/DNA-directed RNA polymerase subunit RPC12/RpoP